MSITTQASAPVPALPPPHPGRLRALAEGWSRFWFSPADPTLLGLLRIACGLILLTVHLQSGLQLQELFGADAWLDTATVNSMRKEMPWLAPGESWESRFQVTDKVVAGVKMANVPDAVAAKVAALKGRKPEGREEFSRQLGKVLDRGEMERCEAIVMAHADLDGAPTGQVPGMSMEEVIAYRKRWGVDPSVPVSRGQAIFSLWFHVTDPTWMMIAHCAMFVVAVLFTLGVCTRVTAVLAWVTALTYIHRLQMAHFGMDTMLAVCLLYLMLSPCGAALSVDRLIARYRVARDYLARRRQVPLLRPAPRASANFALRLMQVHFCMIYMASGTSKLQGSAWWAGTAIWQTAANYEFAGPQIGPVDWLLRFLAEHRLLWELAMNGGALFTLMLEVGLPFLIWFPRWRWLCLCGAAALHTGIALSMGGLTGFSLLMLVMVGAFLPPEAVRRALDWLGRGRSRLWLLFHAREASQARAAGWVLAFDGWGQVQSIDVSAAGQRPTEGLAAGVAPVGRLQLVTEEGDSLTGYALFERLTRSLRALWPLALLTWVPGVGRLGRALAPGAEGAQRASAGDRRGETVGAGR